MHRIILLSVALITFTLSSNAQNNLLTIGNNKIDDYIRVPIYLNNSINVGSFQTRLDYDPTSVNVYSDPIIDKGDFIDFYAPDNSHNKSGYITISTMKLGSGGLSGNLTIGYVRLQVIGGSGGSVKLTPSILVMTDDSGKDIIERDLITATTDEKGEINVQSAYSMKQSENNASIASVPGKSIDVDEGSLDGGFNRSDLIPDASPAQTIQQPDTKSIDSDFSGIVGFTMLIIGFIMSRKLKR